jgi:shikimate kinase/3-dehydroquinate synthase
VKVYLAGMMGSGKTAVGRALAARLGWRFVDTDAEIERASGRTIAEIFAADGEARFREVERAAVAGVAHEAGDAVVALGGGAVLDGRTRALLRETGRTAWLDAPAEALAARLRGREDRPLLHGLDQAGRTARLAEIAAARRAAYEDVADLVVDAGSGDPATLAAAVADLAASRTVRVDLGPRGYDAIVEPGGLARLGRAMRRAGLGPGRCALVVDEAIDATWGEVAAGGLAAAGFDAVRVTLPAGERAKRLAEVERLALAFADARLERGSPIVAVGGGGTTDAAGFAAAIYLRGVPWVAAPTTLLGMVDAAIGGKTGVDLARGKNLAGAFWQPRLVLADPRALATLPPRELRSGLGEVLKYALIGPADLLARVEDHLGGGGLPGANLIARCAAVKAGIVAEDERETGGRRKVLNFGHTIGHAIEAAAGFGGIAHGEAVVLGMRGAVFLSRRLGLMGEDEARRAETLLARFAAPPVPESVSDDAILEFLLRDKKIARGRLLFVLLRGLGDPAIDVEVSREDALAAIAFVREGAQ